MDVESATSTDDETASETSDDEQDQNFYESSYDSANKSTGPNLNFPNFTTAALSIYLRVSKTSRKDFSSLLKILRNTKFSQKDLPPSYKACRRYLRELDSIPIRMHVVTASDSTKNTEVYFYSVKDILHRALSSPSLVSKMYFGPAINVEKPKEFWHGSLWRQSPLFGDDTVDVKGKSLHYETCLQNIKCLLICITLCRSTVQGWRIC